MQEVCDVRDVSRETYSSSSGGNGGKIFDAKAFGDSLEEKRNEEDFWR